MEFMLHPSKECPNDRVTTNEIGHIVKWELWSDYVESFIPVDLLVIQAKFPTTYKLAEDYIKDRFTIESLPIERMIG